MKRFLQAILFLAALIFLFLVCSVRPLDRDTIDNLPYYSETLDRFSDFNFDNEISSGKFSSGFSKTSITPTRSLPMAGYGKRKGAHFEGIEDSLWCRTIVLKNKMDQLALISLDLLIVPPLVTEKLKDELPKIGWSLDQIHFSATHSHHSFGGWQPGIVGRLFAGEFDPLVIDFISEKIITSIQKAESTQIASRLGFVKADASEFVFNRLVREKGKIDPFVRILQFERIDSSKLVYLTFSAHATCLKASYHKLSADYPGLLVKNLEAMPNIKFAMFAAGAVGSHGPTGDDSSNHGKDQSKQVANGLAQTFLNATQELTTQDDIALGSCQLPIKLGEPQFKISGDWAMKPWLFEQAFGDVPHFLKFAKLGNVELVSMPGDFSGELYGKFLGSDSLIINSFNGSYAGYFVDKKWYELEKYEPRTMSWYGPYHTDYLVTLSNQALEEW